MAKLVLHQPDGTVRDIRLDRDRMTIGRRADHDICLPFPAVSADHAEIVTVMADSFLHDLGSTNGTLVNGNRVRKHFLRDHDRIDIGRQQFVYLTNEAETIDPLPPEIVSHELSKNTERVTTVSQQVPETMAAVSAEASDGHSRDAQFAPVDELLTDLMEMTTKSSVAVDIPPSVSVVPPPAPRPNPVTKSPNGNAPASGAIVEVLSGPNAGQSTPMTKAEFVLGKAGVTIAAIRRDGGGYRLLVMSRSAPASLNGGPIAAEGSPLSFGDMIDVAGVKLRFARGSSA